VIEAVSAYGPPATGGGAAGAVVSIEGLLADVSLQTGGPRLIPISTVCGSLPIAVTRDGTWIACTNGDDILVTPRAANSATDGQTLVRADAGEVLQSPAWAPDGRRLAIVTNDGGGCAVALYAVSADHAQATRWALLRFPDLVDPTSDLPRGTIFGLSWSPDGAWLGLMVDARFLAVRPEAPLIYALRLASLGLPPGPSGGAVVDVTVPRANLPLVGETWNHAPPAWSETDGRLALTFADQDEHIVRVDLASGARTTLVSVNEGTLDAVAWTPDSGQLVFALGDPCSYACGGLPSQLYVYTPHS
jgi:hypothetical protein